MRRSSSTTSRWAASSASGARLGVDLLAVMAPRRGSTHARRGPRGPARARITLARSPGSTIAEQEIRPPGPRAAGRQVAQACPEALRLQIVPDRARGRRPLAVGNSRRWRRSLTPARTSTKPPSSRSFMTRLRLCLVIFRISSSSATVRPGMPVHEMQHPVVGPPEAEGFQQAVGIAHEIAVGEKQQLDRDRTSARARPRSAARSRDRDRACSARVSVQRRCHIDGQSRLASLRCDPTVRSSTSSIVDITRRVRLVLMHTGQRPAPPRFGTPTRLEPAVGAGSGEGVLRCPSCLSTSATA